MVLCMGTGAIVGIVLLVLISLAIILCFILPRLVLYILAIRAEKKAYKALEQLIDSMEKYNQVYNNIDVALCDAEDELDVTSRDAEDEIDVTSHDAEDEIDVTT